MLPVVLCLQISGASGSNEGRAPTASPLNHSINPLLAFRHERSSNDRYHKPLDNGEAKAGTKAGLFFTSDGYFIRPRVIQIAYN